MCIMFILHKTESKVEICVQDFIGGHPNTCERMRVRVWVEVAEPWCSVTETSSPYLWLSTVECDEYVHCWVWHQLWAPRIWSLLCSGLFLLHTLFREFSSWEEVEFCCCLFASREVIAILSFILLLSCALDWSAPASWTILVSCMAIELDCGTWLLSVLLNVLC